MQILQVNTAMCLKYFMLAKKAGAKAGFNVTPK